MDQNSSSMSSGSGESSGTRDSTYDVVSVLYHALKGADLCQKFLSDANSDPQLRDFFSQAQEMQRQLADQAKQRLQSSLGGGQSDMAGGGSAFSQFGSGQGDTSLSSGQSTGAQQNDPSIGLSGQSADGQGQRHSEMTTGGGGTTSF